MQHPIVPVSICQVCWGQYACANTWTQNRLESVKRANFRQPSQSVSCVRRVRPTRHNLPSANKAPDAFVLAVCTPLSKFFLSAFFLPILYFPDLGRPITVPPSAQWNKRLRSSRESERYVTTQNVL